MGADEKKLLLEKKFGHGNSYHSCNLPELCPQGLIN